MTDYAGRWTTVRVEVDEGIGWAILNRPEKRNAMSPALNREMRDVLETLEIEDDVKVVVLTGAGESWTAGMDLKEYFREIDHSPEIVQERVRRDASMWQWKLLRMYAKPTIAMVNGWCFGLALPALSESCEAALRKALPTFIPPSNPLDLTAQGLVDPDLYRRTLPPILEDDRFGSVVLGIILTDPKTIRLKLPPITSALRGLRPRKPVIFAALDEGAPFDFPELDQLRELGVACFPSTERALRALALVTKRAQLVSGPVRGNEEPIQPLSLRTGLLSEVESKEILARIGIAVPEGKLATTLHEAVSVAAEIGYPVAMKAQSANLPHKSDVGGVLLGIATEADLQEAWSTLHHSVQIARPEIVLDGALVERMGTKGVELIVGARRDPQWGPVLMVGFGGVLAEAIQDFQLMAPNSSRESIREKLNQLRCSPLLRGFRGAPAADVNATITVLEKVGLLMQSCSEISEIDINPLAVYPDGKGAFALDALISVVDKVR